MLRFILLTISYLIMTLDQLTAKEPKTWVVNYSAHIIPEELASYDLIVLDTEVKHEIKHLQEQEKETLSYLSLGEISNKRDYFSLIKSKGLLLEENPNWKGSFVVDIRKKEWAAFLINQLVPKILFQRYEGILIDTIDQVTAIENRNPKKYAGIKEAAIQLVQAIRYQFPHLQIIVNRGYDILNEIAPYINGVLGESVYTKYDFTSKKYVKVSKEDYKWQVDRLKKAEKINPLLSIFTLDYWEPSDKEMVRQIYRVERENGFIPYVSTIDLQKVVPEPS